MTLLLGLTYPTSPNPSAIRGRLSASGLALLRLLKHAVLEI